MAPLAISYPFGTVNHSLLDVADVWKFDAEAVTKELKEDLKGDDDQSLLQDDVEEKEPNGKEEMDGLLNEVWSMATALNDPIADEDENQAEELEEENTSGEVEESADSIPGVVVAMVPETASVRTDVEEFDLDELWNPFMDETGQEQVDVCEWIPQSYALGAEDHHGGCVDQMPWADPDAVLAESWPPPNIPVEYLDDEFFEEIYGSLDSMKTSEAAGGGGAGGGKNGSRRRRRRSSQKQQQTAAARRPKRPCSFFVEGECRRPDCKFSHDLGSITCRFWIESSCFKGKQLIFSFIRIISLTNTLYKHNT